MLSKTEHIRRILETNFDLPATQVVARLKQRGVEIEPGLVHVTRSTMRKERALKEQQKADELRNAEVARVTNQGKEQAAREALLKQQEEEQRQKEQRIRESILKAQKTRARNAKPLREYIISFMSNNCLTVAEIAQRCRDNGYTSVEENFVHNVRNKLRLMALNGEVRQENKNGSVGYVSNVPAETTVAAPELHLPLPQQPIQPQQSGIAFLVGQLKRVVAKLGKNQTKELIDVLYKD